MELMVGIVPSLLAEEKIVTFSLGKPIREDRSGKELEQLLVADDAGRFAALFFDKRTHLPARIDFSFVATMIKSSEFTRTTDIGDHRKTAGLVLPFSFERRRSTHRVQVSAYQRDRPLPADLFQRVTSDAGVQRIVDATRQ